MNDELNTELQQDEEMEAAMKEFNENQGPAQGRIHAMDREDVEAMCSTPEGLQSVLMQLFAGLLESLHPLREHEIVINDQDIEAALNKRVSIEREDGFFHVKLQD